jgi:hypothetical protein
MCEIAYMVPFVFWYSAVAVSELTRELRLSLLAVAFCVFLKWCNQIRESGVHNPEVRAAKFVVELVDLKRYMNSFSFLDYQKIQ